MNAQNFKLSKLVKKQRKCKINLNAKNDLVGNDRLGHYVVANSTEAQKKTGKYYKYPKYMDYKKHVFPPSAHNNGNIKTTQDGKRIPPSWSRFYQDTRSLIH